MPPFVHTMPIRFSDIDHAGIVYFAKFFHYAHVALEEFFLTRLGGRAYADLLDRQRIGFPSVDAQCSFSAPLSFGDFADVELEIARLGRSSIEFHFRVYRRDPPVSAGPDPLPAGSASSSAAAIERVLCAKGRYVTAVVDLDEFQAIPIPDSLRDVLAPLVVGPE